MSDYPLVSIIIVNWNGEDVLKDCFSSLEKISYRNWELIFVDNGSTDGSEELVKKYKLKYKNYQLIKNKENLGFAPANNQGVKKAEGEYILLLNNDTKVSAKFLEILIEKMESDEKIGVIQPKIKIMDYPNRLDNAGSFLTITGFLTHWGYMEKDSPRFNKEQLIFSAKGACLLTRKELVEKLGLFDPDYFSYFEETDFCWRVWLAGFKVLYYPKTFIYHKVGFTSKKQDQLTVNYHSVKNRISSLIKNLNPVNLFFIGGLHLLLNTALIFFYLLKGQLHKSKMIINALLWNILNLDDILKKRSIVQKLRVVSDQELFKYILRQADWKEMFLHFQRVEANFKK